MHACDGSVAAVRVRQCIRISFPVVLVFVNVVSKHCEDRAVISFDLTVRLRVVRGGEDVRDSGELTDGSEEFRGELLSVIRYRRRRRTRGGRGRRGPGVRGRGGT